MSKKRRISAVYVGLEAEVPGDKKLVGYECASCSQISVLPRKLEDPSCLHCGHIELEAAEEASWKGRAKSLKRTADRESHKLIAVECSECNSHLMMDEKSAKVHVAAWEEAADIGKICCPVDGTALGRTSRDCSAWTKKTTRWATKTSRKN